MPDTPPVDLTPPAPLSGAERGEMGRVLPLSSQERGPGDVGGADIRAAQRTGAPW
jgi:hypothetical protein